MQAAESVLCGLCIDICRDDQFALDNQLGSSSLGKLFLSVAISNVYTSLTDLEFTMHARLTLNIQKSSAFQ